MVGIGGVGMSGVARILLDRGYTVTGSDMKESRTILALRAAGAVIATEHCADNLALTSETPTCVVTSFAAIPQDNAELIRARELGIPVVTRSDVLGALLRDHVGLLIAGTHGKTSTTSLTIVALQQAGLDPSFAVGGQLSTTGTNAHHGTGSVFVAEADESDASLLTYSPNVAVVTNIEADHLDFYGSEESYIRVFDEFAGRVVDGGFLVICVDDRQAAELGERLIKDGDGRIHVVGYGTVEAAARHPSIPMCVKITDITPKAESTHAVIRIAPPDGRQGGVSCGASDQTGECVYHLAIQIPGTHMVLNAAAAIASAVLVGADWERAVSGVNSFQGVRRRFESHGTIAHGYFEGASVYDDYAHHPTEVRAVLTAAREKIESMMPVLGRERRVIVVFQPHMYSRTEEFAEDFAHALSLADEAIVMDIYGARERPRPGVTSDLIINQMTIPTHASHRIDDVPRLVASIAGPGDIILTMGAGTVTMLADPIVAALNESLQ
ncbi:UDP-N-acetylmuramate--L-alanine ligase [Corynebacterium kroppenstedtii]|uniref:UDP-N-acetylmuramate--L-alanine ligase n=1 Tax=Corynebacterium sp. PCR 32 TaxID=3351342 RepID=UPI0030B6D692